MSLVDISYEELPRPIKDNLTPDQWIEAQRGLILEGHPVPDSTSYINVKNGQILPYEAGQRAAGPLLPAHELSGARGKSDEQFENHPAGAEGER